MTDDVKESFALSLKGEGINIEKDVDRQTALAIVAAAIGGASSIAQMGGAPAKSQGNLNSGQSLREFLNEVGPKTNKERIASIAFYLEDHKGKESISKGDIESGFRSAREQMPKNLARDISSTLADGWLDEADESGRYFLTNTGSRAVQSRFGRQSSE